MERKLEKSDKILLIVFGTMVLVCIALLIPVVQNLILRCAEKILLHRELRKPEKWIEAIKKFSIFGIFAISILIFLIVYWQKLKKTWLIPIHQIPNNKNYSFLFGAVYGMILFIFLYGIKILNVKYDAWLLTGGDLSQHYLGWISYRQSAWCFPVGLMEKLSYPNLTSMIYTDSIPIFAFLFKIISPILPETFQYFGLYGLVSYALMGGFSTLLLKEFIENLSASIILSTIFIYSPYILQRMYGHTSLAGQWLIIAALYLWLCYPKKSFMHNCVAWTALLFCAVGIHSYFFPMCLIFCFANGIEDFCLQKSKETLIKAFIRFFCAVAGAALSLFVFGGLYGHTNPSTGGLGHYNSNLNTFFDPQGYSLFFKNLKHGSGQYEGFGYLGLGVIIIAFVCMFYLFCIQHNSDKYIFKKISKTKFFIILATFIMFTILAVANKVMLGEQVILDIKLVPFIEKLLGIFRASGRFIWGACYLVAFVSIEVLFNAMNEKHFRKIPIALFIVLIQLIDLNPTFTRIHNTKKYKEYIEYKTNLNEDAWLHLLENKKHIIFQPYNSFSFNNGMPITYLALKNDGDINTSYFARMDTESLNKFSETIDNELKNGIVRDDAIYIFTANSLNLKNYPLTYYVFDGKIIGIKKQDEVLEEQENIFKYNVHSELSDITDIAVYLEKINKSNYTVFISVKDEASGGISDEALQKLSELGLQKSLKSKWRYSYYAVIDGCGIISEQLSTDKLNYVSTIGDVKFSIISAGMECGNTSSIIVNGNEFSKNKRGLNIVVYDSNKKEFVDSVCFDTCSKEMTAYR